VSHHHQPMAHVARTPGRFPRGCLTSIGSVLHSTNRARKMANEKTLLYTQQFYFPKRCCCCNATARPTEEMSVLTAKQTEHLICLNVAVDLRSRSTAVVHSSSSTLIEPYKDIPLPTFTGTCWQQTLYFHDTKPIACESRDDATTNAIHS
jgi:hypothetical protein